MRDISGGRNRDLRSGELGTVRGTVSKKTRLIKAGDYSQRELFEGWTVTDGIRRDSGARRLTVRRSESGTVRQCAGDRRPKVTSPMNNRHAPGRQGYSGVMGRDSDNTHGAISL
jgi:hypothetical protein